jgi:hypothetical protein
MKRLMTASREQLEKAKAYHKTKATQTKGREISEHHKVMVKTITKRIKEL